MRSLIFDDRARPLRNLAPKTTGIGLGSTGRSTRDNTVYRAGSTSSVRITPEGSTSDTFYAPEGDSGGMRVPFQPGRTYTVSGWIYLAAPITPGAGATRHLRIVCYTRIGTAGYVVAGVSPQANNEPGWTRLSVTISIPAGATEAFARFYNGSQSPTDLVWWTNIMITEGAVLTAFADGATPGWRWLGAEGQSQSVGYPYTLESIAGAPLGAVEGPGITLPTGIGAFEDRTLYYVYDLLGGVATNYGFLAAFGSGATQGGMRIQTHAASTTDMSSRFDTNEGTANRSFRLVGKRTAGRHIQWASVSGGMTLASVGMDSGDLAGSGSLEPGNGMTSGNIFTSADSGEHKSVVAIGFNRAHNVETRRRVVAWLARRYNVPVAA